jgi:hypothetical protein
LEESRLAQLKEQQQQLLLAQQAKVSTLRGCFCVVDLVQQLQSAAQPQKEAPLPPGVQQGQMPDEKS